MQVPSPTNNRNRVEEKMASQNFRKLFVFSTSLFFLLFAYVAPIEAASPPPAYHPPPRVVIPPHPPAHTPPVHESPVFVPPAHEPFGQRPSDLGVHPDIPELGLKIHPDPTGNKYNAKESPGEKYWTKITEKFGVVHSVSKATIFIQSHDGILYLTTNFVRRGFGDAPVFLLKPDDLLNDVLIERKINALTGGLKLSETSVLKIFLDKDVNSSEFKSIFNNGDQSLRINNSELRHAEVYIEGGDAIPLVRIDRVKPPPRWAAKFNECCVRTGIPPDWVGWQKLSEIPFDKERVQIVSLFADSETSHMLGSLDSSRNIRKPSEIVGDPIEALRTLIESGSASSPVIIIGHVEDGSFKVEGKGGFSVPIDSILEIINEAGRPVFLIGCYTVEHMASRPQVRDFAGMANELYPREIVPRIMSAQKSSSNLQEFIKKISSEESQVWIGKDFIKSTSNNSVISVRAAISKPMSNGIMSIVGTLRMYIPCKLFGRCA
jgi:hypothetical protein